MSLAIGRVGDLEIDEDHDFQRRIWKLQRRLWTGMAALIGLALLGLFGSGPLSEGTAGAEGGPLHLRYQRLTRFHAPTTLKIQLGPSREPQTTVQLELSQAYLEGVQIERIEPEPERVIAGAAGVTYQFHRRESDRPTPLSIHLKPQSRGLISGVLRLEGGPSIGFRQWIYP